MKKAVVFGAGGFIGSHLVKKLKKEGKSGDEDGYDLMDDITEHLVE